MNSDATEVIQRWSFRWMVILFLIALPLCGVGTFGITFLLSKLLMKAAGC